MDPCFISIGPTCVPAEILKAGQLRKCSYGFDWARSGSHHLRDFLQLNHEVFMQKHIYTPSVPLTQPVDPSTSILNTVEPEAYSPLYGYPYYYNPHRNLYLEETHDYLDRCFFRTREVFENHNRKKILILADYINKAGAIFLNKTGLISEYLDDLFGSRKDIICLIIRMELTQSYAPEPFCLIEDRRTNVSLMKFKFCAALDDPRLRHRIYKKIGKYILGCNQMS